MALHPGLDGAFNSDTGAGFADPVLSSQSVFRCVMNALARPGSVHTLTESVKAPSALMPAAAAIALALFDHDTPIWIDHRLAADPATAAWIRFQTSAPVTSDAASAAFALIHDGMALPDFGNFALGTLEYPDRSATLIVQVDTFTADRTLVLSGPGVAGVATIQAGHLPADFVTRMQANRALFPRGVDLLLVSGTQVLALPRSTQVTAKGD